MATSEADFQTRRLAWSGRFIREHPSYVALLLAGISLILLLTVPIEYPSILAPLGVGVAQIFAAPVKAAINAGIFALTFLAGMRTTALALARIQREMLILTEVRKKIELARQEWSTQGSLPWTLDMGRVHVLPEKGSGDAKPLHSTTGKLVTAVHADAIDARFDPIPVVLERALADFEGAASTVKVWQNYAVRLGILFTFIGLVVALGPIRDILAATVDLSDSSHALEWVDHLRGGIGTVVRGLTLAFGASIAGLLAALSLQMAVGLINRRERVAVEVMGTVASDLQFLFRRARNESPLAKDIEALRNHLATHKDEVYASSNAIHADVAALEQRLEAIRQARDDMMVLMERQTRMTDLQSKLAQDQASQHERLVTLVESSVARAAGAQAETLAAATGAFRETVNTLAQELKSGSVHSAQSVVERRLVEILEHAATASRLQGIGTRVSLHGAVVKAPTIIRILRMVRRRLTHRPTIRASGRTRSEP